MAATVPANGHHHNGAQNYDLEKALNTEGGAGLARQISVQLTAEQFERLYLQPGGQGGKGDLSKRFGNPTALGLISFLLCLAPFSTFLMGWADATTDAALVVDGTYYFIGGLGLVLAGIMEWILGNTFPFTVFISFGCFWLNFGHLFNPSIGIAEALPSTSADYNKGLAWYLACWGVIVALYWIASLRTNVVFVLLFLFLDIDFWLLTALYFKLGDQSIKNLAQISKAAGVMSFLTCACGFWLLIVVLCGSTGIPCPLPVGDLSNFMSKKPKEA